jgi:hypothetical protein
LRVLEPSMGIGNRPTPHDGLRPLRHESMLLDK